jgi:hypothetical protein
MDDKHKPHQAVEAATVKTLHLIGVELVIGGGIWKLTVVARTASTPSRRSRMSSRCGSTRRGWAALWTLRFPASWWSNCCMLPASVRRLRVVCACGGIETGRSHFAPA